MFCIACGRQMGDDERFCSQCGTRRAVIPAAAEPAIQAPPPPRSEAPVAPPVRPVRSTAEIMPMRVQRPPAPPAMERPSVEPEPPQYQPEHVPWPESQVPDPAPYYAPEPPVVSRAEPVAPQAVAPSRAAGYPSVPFAATPGAHDTDHERRGISPVLIGAIIVALIALGGIFWMVRSSLSGPGKTAANVAITIYPTSAKVAVGKSVDFVAEVSGAPASDVTWNIAEEGSGGEVKTRGASAKGDSISLYSTFIAPPKPGTYHLVATSTADTKKSATAEITVTAKEEVKGH